ncbi:hypothetical protein [Streptomyces sp. NPDC013489]|uniref:hypothetical protein n=1 Tax=Streptomyces sp. NPDC013489 TaxID=3155606 RepID=UPI0033F2A1D7
MLALGAVLGSVLTLLVVAAWRRVNRPSHCIWCAQASAWPTSEHDPRSCKGYVQELRRQRRWLKSLGYEVVEPDPFGEMYLLDEEIEERYGALNEAEGDASPASVVPE